MKLFNSAAQFKVCKNSNKKIKNLFKLQINNKMADFIRKMSPDNPTQILTAHDLSNLRALQSGNTASTSVATTTPATFGSSNNNNNNNNNSMVISTIPLDGHALLIQQSQVITTSQQQPQPQRATTTLATTNGLRTVHAINNSNNNVSKNISNLLAAAAASKATILSTSNGNSGNSSSGSNMPTTSKYVFLQQNSNGQYTTYEGTTNANASNVGNIVLLATEPIDLNGSNGTEQQQLVGDNDEELRSLAWLNDSNLIKGIVKTQAAAAAAAAATGGNSNGQNNATKRNVSNNICIVNASNAHELIEELPVQHVASEEHVTTISSSGSSNNHTELADTQITTLSVSDFQQQFIASNKRFSNIVAGSNNNTNGNQHLHALANFALSQQDATTIAARNNGSSDQQQQQQQQHVYGNIAALGATTTVHVGPSGTTTVVEYKSNGNLLPTQQRQLLSNNIASAAGNATTITATNLSNNKNNYVPSTTASNNNNNNSNNNNIVSHNHSAASTNASAAATISTLTKQLTTLPNTIVTTNTTTNSSSSNNNNNSATIVVNGNGTTNTIYQGQKQQSNNNNNNNSNNNNNKSNNNSNAVSTTHHPHKKYLREKMNVLDHGGGSNGSSSVLNNSTNLSSANNNNNNNNITIVSSPASSNNSLSSSSSTSSSTAAVNGGNSPVSKSFYAATPVAGNNAVNYSNSSNASSTAGYIGNAAALSPTTTASATKSASPLTTTGLTAYTIVSQNQQQHAAASASSPAMSSPEPPISKDFYAFASTPQHQQQHQQQQQQHYSMRSPTSYSSYDDSLKDFEISTTNSSASGMGRLATSTPQHQQYNSQHQQQQQQQQQQQNTPKSSASHGGAANNANTPQKQKHPNNVPYDPLVHTHNKPPYSFSSLIFMAIEGSNEKALPVKEIYAWIVQHFPYFKTAPNGWKNSVRHNLSLNKSFVKVEKAPNMGKGSLWRVEQQQRPNLIQALTRSPFFPNSAVDKIALKSGATNNGNGAASYDTIDGNPAPKLSASSATTHIDPRFDPRLFPNLSKAFKDMSEHNLLNDVIADVSYDETPSDYSTSNLNNNNNHKTNNNNNNASKYNFTTSLQNGSGSVGGGTSILGSLGNYESIERLARDCGADSIDDVNAATAMLALKHGPKVFTETFQNGSGPVITSSPSEDHTYSAGGGSNAGSGASTPLTNGNGTPQIVNSISNGNGVLTTNGNSHNGCADNQSNCASSDAAYESSEENHQNITPEELADQQRHRDGVDALLSLSLASSLIDIQTNSCSPTKRPSSTSVEEEHISACNDSDMSSPSTATQHNNHMGKMILLSSAAAANAVTAYALLPNQTHHAILDEGYNTQGYYGAASANHHNNNHQHLHHHMSTTPTPNKKPKPLRSLRTKIKRKTWLR